MSRSGRSCAPAPTPWRSTTPSTLKGERRLKNGSFSSLTSYADPRRPTMKIHDVRLHIVRPEEIGLGGRKAPKRLSSKSGLFTGVRRRSQPVEKVGVGPVGGPREPENRSETIQKRRIRHLDR